MRFVINWSTPNVGMDLEYTNAVVDYINHGTRMDEFEGFKILERVFFFLRKAVAASSSEPTACDTCISSPAHGPTLSESPWKSFLLYPMRDSSTLRRKLARPRVNGPQKLKLVITRPAS